MDISKAFCSRSGCPMQARLMACPECDSRLEAEFDIPALARLSLEDQLFVAAFVRHHGSIKKMESLFGISYPTVKNRLNAITEVLDRSMEAPSPNSQVLDQLARGEISVEQALERLS